MTRKTTQPRKNKTLTKIQPNWLGKGTPFNGLKPKVPTPNAPSPKEPSPNVERNLNLDVVNSPKASTPKFSAPNVHLNNTATPNQRNLNLDVVNSPKDQTPNAPSDQDYQERLLELNKKVEQCKKECDQLQKEKKGLDDFMEKKKIEGITLSTKQTLIDLLIERVLDPSSEWRNKIDMLIHIPTSLKDDEDRKYLRGGDYFEALFQLAIAIGVLPMFANQYVRFHDIRKYVRLKPFHNYLHTKTIQNSGGKEQGISDITFETSPNEIFEPSHVKQSYACGENPKKYVASTNPFYFISVKGFKREKSIKDEYDVPLLSQQIVLFPEKNKHIIVCVQNKKQFLANLSRIKIDFLKHSIDYVIGYDEVMEAFEQFRINFFRRAGSADIAGEVLALFPPDTIYKPSMNLYFHQELVVDSVLQRIKDVQLNRTHFLCIGVLPRGGKSFIAGGIIDAHKKQIQKQKKGYNVLFLTSAVSETIEQFKEDLIEKYVEFADFQFVDVRKYKPSDHPNKFYFMSRQLAGQEQEEVEEGIDGIANMNEMFDTLKDKLGVIPELDIIFFDEAHVGITKQMRSNFQRSFELFKTPVVMMTATYKKPSLLLDSTKDLFIWDLQDIKDMKNLPILGLDEFKSQEPDVLARYPNAFGLLKKRVGMGEKLEQLAKPYQDFPTPNFISLTFSPDTIQQLIKSGTGFNMEQVFKLKLKKDRGDLEIDLANPNQNSQWGELLANRDHAIRFRQFMTPEQDSENAGDKQFPFLQNKERKYRALNQIFSIAQKNGSRPVQGKPFSILMFLPFADNDTPIGELCRVWGSFMLESKYWRENFVFLTLSPYNNKDYKRDPGITIKRAVEKGLCHREDHPEYNLKLKKLILEVEQEALRQGKGLVLLTGNVAKMGISLKCIDVIFLMTDHGDADDTIQKMYRALTDDPPYKKDGFIVDMDVKRVIKAMFEYDLEKDKTRHHTIVLPTVSERIQKVWELCNWGQDSFMEDHPEMDLNDIMDAIKRLVLTKVEDEILYKFGKEYKDIETTQMNLISEDSELYSDMMTTLQNTTSKSKSKSKKGKAITLAERGTHIPGNTDLNAVNEQVPKDTFLTPEEIEKKMGSIIKTFVNALVIKSSEPWNNSLNLVALLDKYYRDKELSGDVDCECEDTEDCKKEHNNLYEAAFCELRNYAIITFEEGGKKKEEYNPKLHKEIMRLVEDVFKTTTLFVEWNMYIETLLREIHSTTMRMDTITSSKTTKKTKPKTQISSQKNKK